jgi:hypothetical protein
VARLFAPGLAARGGCDRSRFDGRRGGGTVRRAKSSDGAAQWPTRTRACACTQSSLTVASSARAVGACCVCARVAWQSGSSRFVRTHWAQPRSSYEIRVCMRSKQSTLDRLEPCRGLRCLSRDVGWSHSQQAGEQASPGVRNVLSRLHAGCPRPRIGASDSFWHGVWTLSDTLYSEIECSPRRASTQCLCLPRGPRRN